MPNDRESHKLADEIRSAAAALRSVQKRTVAPPPLPKPKPKLKRRTTTATRSRATGRNDYLASLLDPFNGKGIGIPDFDTSKVLTVQTTNRIPITVNSGGRAVYTFRPAYYHGVTSIGMQQATGTQLHSMAAGSANLGVLAPSVTSEILKTADRDLFAADFEQVRPVSMGLRFIPKQNITAIQGLMYVIDHVPGDALVAPLSNTVASPGGIEQAIGLPSLPQNAPAFTSIQDIEASADHINRISMETVTAWTPDLPDNILWKGLGNNAGSPTSFGTLPYSWTNTTLGGVDTYNVPGKYTDLETNAGAPFWAPGNADAIRVDEGPLSSVVWAFEGAVALAELGDCEIVTNWEVQVRPGLSSILPTRVVPSNPDEFAQANNVSQMVPHTYYPQDPNEPTTRLMPHIMSTAEHLYDGTPKKEAVEGTSLWSKIKKIGGKVLGAAAPFLSAIPIAGPILGPGAAFLSSLASS